MSQPGTKRVVKAPGKGTFTYKMFEQNFFDLASSYPKYLKGLTRGQAVNLCQGLNRCNVEHFKAQGAPDFAISLSAKAKEEQDGTGLWYVEISNNYKRQGEASPSRQGRGLCPDWMGRLLSEGESFPPNLSTPASSGAGSPGFFGKEAVPEREERDPQEDLINRFMQED